MAILSIYIPDDSATRVFDAIAANYRYQPTVSNPVAGQNIITWASDTGVLLSLASGVGYVGDLPGTKAPDYTIYPDSENLLGVGQSAGYTGSVGYTGSMGIPGADGTQGGGYVNLTMSGPISPPVTGTARFYSPIPMAINTIYANLSTSPTGGNLTFVIKKNGTSIGTVFQMPATLMEPVSVNIVLVATDYLTLDVGGGSSADLNVKLKYI